VAAARKRIAAGLAAAFLTVGLAGCTSNGSPEQTASADEGAGTPRPSTRAPGAVAQASSASTASPAVKATATASTKPKPAPPPGLGPGAKGPEIQAMEAKLDALKYSVGKIDGVYDSLTSEGVLAFQKVNGMARTGRATPEVLSAVAAAGAPAPMMPNGGPDRVEIDLKRQVLFVYKGGALLRTLMASTGGGYRYCVDGACAKAVTPGGSFRTTWRVLGKHTSRLGVLYNPVFFNGGIAVHGAPSVPAYPASHGCVRIPMSASRWFYDTVPRGFAVYVLGGVRAPVPFNEPAPNGAPPADAGTTTAAPTPVATTSTTVVATTVVPATTATTAATTTSSTTTSTTSPSTTTAAPQP
jgi:peptidoglycan hydrolase-like protein with peptidoglycan-binding domain